MSKLAILLVVSLACAASAMPERFRRSYGLALGHPVATVPGVAAVPALAAVPTLTAVHSQRLIAQAPAVHTVAHPTTVLQTVQTGNAIVGHQKVADQVVGKTADVNGYAFSSEVRHDAPVHAIAAPVIAAAPVPVPVYGPAPVLAGPAVYGAPGPIVAAPAPLALPAYKKA